MNPVQIHIYIYASSSVQTHFIIGVILFLQFQYEEQIEKLEQQVRQFQQKSSLGDHPYSHRLALEKELESVRERHRNETAELQVQLEQLQTTVDKLKKDDGK